MASKSLGTLTLDLVARTGNFVAGMDKAERSAAQRSKEIARNIEIASAALGGMAAAAAAAATAVTISTVNTVKGLQNLATVSNSTLGEFQRYAAGASQLGVEQEKLGDIFKDTSDKVGDFLTTGGGELADFFEKIAPQVGVTAEQFKVLSGPQALQLFASSLEKANLSQAEMTFYMESIADEASALLPLLRNGGKGFEQFADEAERAGAIIGDDTADAAMQFADVMRDFDVNLQGVRNSIADELLPLLNSLSDTFEGTTENISSAIRGIPWQGIADGAAIVSIAVGGKLTASASASALAFAAATLESVRYQAALARMAGVSATAAAGITAMSVAARTASAAMGLLGGPLGIVLTAAGALAYFAVRSKDAKVDLDDLSSSVDSARVSFDNMTRAQAALAMLDVREALEATASAASIAAAQVETYQVRLQATPGSKKAEEWNESLIRAQAEFETLSGKAEQYRKDLELLNSVMDGAGKAPGAAEATAAFVKLEAQINERIALYGKEGEAAKLRYQIATGSLEGMTKAEAEALLPLYERYDLLVKDGAASELAAAARKRNADEAAKAAQSIASEVDALQKQADTLGMSSEALAIYNLELAKASPAQMTLARAALETISAFEKQEAYKELLSELRTEEEQLTDQMRERLAVLDAMQGLEPDERMQVAGRIAGAATTEAPEFGGLDASVGGPFGELLKIDEAEEKLQEWYDTQLEMLEQFRQDRADLAAVWDEEELALKQQHEDELARIEQARQMAQLASAESIFGDLAGLTKTFAGEQSGLYKAMFAVQKAAAIAQSMVAIQTGIAMAAENPFPANLAAMASVAAATASIVSNIGAIGMAHDGIDSIPATGTWLLEKGERVTTAETSAKLDKTLSDIQSGGAGGAVNVNFIEDASKAGTVETRREADGSLTIDGFISNVMGDGKLHQALSRKYGLQGVGQ